jgi:hypothetical protein
VGHPILLLRGYDKTYMYGQLSYARPNEGGLLCPSQFCARRPAAARLFFGKVCGGRGPRTAIFIFCAKEKTAVRQQKLRAPISPAVCRKTIACSLSCEQALLGRRSLSASRGFGFRRVPRGHPVARRRRMLAKSFNRRWNLRAKNKFSGRDA